MPIDFDQVLALKASAKSLRADGHWRQASEHLHAAITVLEDHLSQASLREQGQRRSELADCYGVLGGIERRQGLSSPETTTRFHHLDASRRAYDKGYEHELNLGAARPSAAPSTYNRVNRLTARVLLNPRVLHERGAADVDVVGELVNSEKVLADQLKTVRHRDPWVVTDLGAVKLLLGRKDALPTLHELDRLRPPKFVYESTLETLRPLAKVASGVRPELPQAVEQLERSARYGIS